VITAALERECEVFCHYLTGSAATEYVVRKYVAGHASMPAAGTRVDRLIDRWLLAVARTGPTPARFADSYARMLRPHGPLRHRLVLLLAILENSPGFHERLDHATRGAPMGIMLELGITGVGFVLRLALGLACFGPVHLVSGAARD
jgi:hypothetical protein